MNTGSIFGVYHRINDIDLRIKPVIREGKEDGKRGLAAEFCANERSMHPPPDIRCSAEPAGDVVFSLLIFRFNENVVGYVKFDNLAQVHIGL